MSKDMLGVAVRKLVTLPGHVLGIVCDLLEKLVDPEWVEATKRFLRKEEPWPKLAERVFPVWKTVKLGVHKTLEAYKDALESNRFRIGDYARKILKGISVRETEMELDLVVATPAELGLANGGTFDQICARATEHGLEKCPAEVGPALRLAYPDQPYGEWLRVAMEPETGPGGRLSVFDVDRGRGERWLFTRWFDPEGVWSPGRRFVFVRPRK